MANFQVLSWPAQAETYNTDSANDAWNWVMTAESPTALYVVKNGQIIRPPSWFTRNESSYDVKKFSIL